MNNPAWTYSPVAAEHMAARNLTDLDMLGAIPDMLDTDNPAPAQEQLDAGYKANGGWQASDRAYIRNPHEDWPMLRYADDPPARPVARTDLRDERVYLFEGAWVAIIQPNGDAAVARMD